MTSTTTVVYGLFLDVTIELKANYYRKAACKVSWHGKRKIPADRPRDEHRVANRISEGEEKPAWKPRDTSYDVGRTAHGLCSCNTAHTKSKQHHVSLAQRLEISYV